MTKTLLKTKQKIVSLDRYSGKWVAFIDNRIVAWADTLKELAQKIKKWLLRKNRSIFKFPAKMRDPYIL